MSLALFGAGGLRFWEESEIELRDAFIQRVSAVVKRVLADMNPAWRFYRVEGPILQPRGTISAAYDDGDIFVTNHIWAGQELCLRAETTPSSYAYARHIGGKLPVCVWQAGISSRRETNDGASAAKMRFNNFWQLEFQCIHGKETKADYRAALIEAVRHEIERFCMVKTVVEESDRLPSYSMSTIDICAVLPDGKHRELASCSLRTDYSEAAIVTEIAVGLCRVATLAAASFGKRKPRGD